MKATFLDQEDESNPLNGRRLASEEVAQAFHDSSGRKPFFCSLETERGTLLVGVGHDVWCVQFTSVDGVPPYLMATTGTADEGDACVDFLSGGTPSPVPRRYCLPRASAEAVVAHFLLHGVRLSDVGWVEI